jgi:16S rRNA pseudouridine516 synthase
MRLDKYLVNLGIGSRRQVKELIKNGNIKVNDLIVSKPELHINEKKDTINLDGVDLTYHKFYYYMLNKPQDVISAVSDFQYITVMDIMDIKPKKGLFPVGRLDKDTEGLLLITNDGELSHSLLSPVRHVDKKYFVCVDGVIKTELVEYFKLGFDIGLKHNTKPATLEILSDNTAYVTLTEGKYHQVKKMFKHFGLNVTYLKRVRMGPLELDEALKPGEYRSLTEDEKNKLLNMK